MSALIALVALAGLAAPIAAQTNDQTVSAAHLGGHTPTTRTPHQPTTRAYQWGLPGDVAVAGDFDGDGRPDLTVFRPSTGTWFVRTSTSSYTAFAAYQFGLLGDVPMAADYDGDGRIDLAVYRPRTGEWFIRYWSAQGY